ncbi:SRPBCC family protein [Streptomyces xanthophaeus]|uniref:Polyketide cyclase n=1 Tax=Streptomyces xanthophaeus TaxID=67385 RepID=A0A919GSK3_9ACTN|nr:SRPBCC family protein [Streptomyces xanthophaeus]WST21026.1 SRPBCC family protein [Streptomyces xanthophaeus]WST63987.1 SRPBCC family protein [Streptomyces xanthophaeus]GHI83803.1 polyketide cyclase [Streptomyces xanthophaeus]
MARRLRPVGLDFAEVAPIRLVFEADATAPPEAVYQALAEELEGWPKWFRAVTLARPTHGGAGREVRLMGGVRFQETIMAADPEQRYAYRADETNAPGLRALLEEWRLTPAGSGTHVRWTFAADGPTPFRLALTAARPGLGHSFRTAVRTLDRRLAARRAAGQ